MVALDAFATSAHARVMTPPHLSRRSWLFPVGCVALLVVACGGTVGAGVADAGVSSEGGVDAGDTPDAPGFGFGFEAAAHDASASDASLMTGSGGACSANDAGVGLDGCPQIPCPTGYVCASETGGVAGGGGSHCIPIPAECATSITCACFGTCACGISFGRPELCDTTPNHPEYGFGCDNGIR